MVTLPWGPEGPGDVSLKREDSLQGPEGSTASVQKHKEHGSREGLPHGGGRQSPDWWEVELKGSRPAGRERRRAVAGRAVREGRAGALDVARGRGWESPQTGLGESSQ